MASTVPHCQSSEAILHIMPGTKIRPSALLAVCMRSEIFF